MRCSELSLDMALSRLEMRPKLKISFREGPATPVLAKITYKAKSSQLLRNLKTKLKSTLRFSIRFTS